VPATLRVVKIGEWDNLGRARGLLQRQLGELRATEYATHVTINPETGRLRILVATDVGLIEYHYGPAGPDPEGAWLLRGEVYRWSSVRGLRLQTDAQLDEDSGEVRGLWRLIAEQPKIELTADTTAAEDRALEALLPLAHACMERAG
jgi:hypothetical protein